MNQLIISVSYWDSIVMAVGTVWLAVGPLIGVVVGALLTRRIQRQQWVADSRKQEYRELMTALSHSATVLIDFYFYRPPGPHGTIHSPEEQQEAFKVYADALRILKIVSMSPPQ